MTIATAACLLGCLSGRAPSKAESYFFDVKTNLNEAIVWKTNIVVTTQTNGVTVTNYVPVSTTNQTPSYDWSPNQHAKAASEVAGIAGSAFGIPFAGTALTTLIGLYGWFNTARKGANTGAALAQIIETGREVLKQVPNGAKYDQAYVNFMQQHQTETGTIMDVAKIIDRSVDNSDAKTAARDIIDVVGAVGSPTAGPKVG